MPSKRTYTELYNPNENFLFTLDQLNAAKTYDRCLPARCLNCGEIFYISRNDYNAVLKNARSCKYCSRTCCGNEVTGSVTKPCLQCGKLVTKSIGEAERYPNFFCCQSHAASYNNKRRPPRSEESRQKTSQALRALHPPKEPKRCAMCGQTVCKRPDICKSQFLRSPNLAKLGFDMTSVGTERIYEEYDSLKARIFDLYIVQQRSMLDIQKMFDIKSLKTLWLLFNFLGISARSISESNVIAVTQGKIQKRPANPRFQHGWHTTWNNKQIFYRSSYELDLCLQLDEKHIDYEVESKHIPYFNSFKNRNAIAIPDFYIPSTNTIIEVKSTYTYNKQEMVDKSNEYKRLGYNFLLYLDHHQYDYCP